MHSLIHLDQPGRPLIQGPAWPPLCLSPYTEKKETRKEGTEMTLDGACGLRVDPAKPPLTSLTCSLCQRLLTQGVPGSPLPSFSLLAALNGVLGPWPWEGLGPQKTGGNPGSAVGPLGKRGITKVRRTPEAWDKQQLCQRRAPGASQRPACLL